MRYEIDMMSVGCADSKIIRLLDDANLEYVVLIDAGNRSDGKKIMDHINKYTNQKYIDLAICTHPDSDHIGGFFDIVGTMMIREFWIHDPSNHVDYADVKSTISRAKLQNSLRYVTESLSNSDNLLAQIDKFGIPRFEPFTGKKHAIIPIRVLGPSVDYYESLLKNFRDIEHLFKEEAMVLESHSKIYLEALDESLSLTLDEKNDKSFENASSAIILFEPDGKKYLFTADATPEAQMHAAHYTSLSNLYFLDVPHHGSKYNLTSELVSLYSPEVSYISADGSRKYPSRAVVNSLKNCGSIVFCTASAGDLHHAGTIGMRAGYVYPAKEL